MQVRAFKRYIPLSKIFYRKISIIYFLIPKFKHVFWVLKRTVLLRRFFWVPTTYVLVEK